MAQAAQQANSPSNEQVREAVEGIEDCHRDLLSERGAYMNRCRVIRDSMTARYDAAKEHGINKKELRALIKQRDHERKAEEARLALEDDERETFDMLKASLGDFANLPLGKAALAAQAQGDVLDRLQA